MPGPMRLRGVGGGLIALAILGLVAARPPPPLDRADSAASAARSRACQAGALRRRHRLRRGDLVHSADGDDGAGPDLHGGGRRPGPGPRDRYRRHRQPGLLDPPRSRDRLPRHVRRRVHVRGHASPAPTPCASTPTAREPARSRPRSSASTTPPPVRRSTSSPPGSSALDRPGGRDRLPRRASARSASAGASASSRPRGSATLIHEVVRPDGTTVCAANRRRRVLLPARRRRHPPDHRSPTQPAPTPATTGSCSRSSRPRSGARR